MNTSHNIPSNLTWRNDLDESLVYFDHGVSVPLGVGGITSGSWGGVTFLPFTGAFAPGWLCK